MPCPLYVISQDLRPFKNTDRAISNFSFEFQDIPVVDNATSPDANPVFPRNGDDSGTCTFNGLTFKKGRPLLTMALDSIQQWTVQGVQAHPLHVHINPMQIQSFMRDGAALNSTCDEEYGFLCIGDFVDTLQVPDTQGTAGAIVRYRAADYTGEQTLHCHYLVHEDQGCLTYAKILPAQREAGERG